MKQLIFTTWLTTYFIFLIITFFISLGLLSEYDIKSKIAGSVLLLLVEISIIMLILLVIL
ncbi:hypothetical protein DRO29_01200 [Candidatus Bathyarchaeota archaeon]|nr:MAG: hypothetical protein DRO29_01200 [Candidatus Bathyarchaeota archaeon]